MSEITATTTERPTELPRPTGRATTRGTQAHRASDAPRPAAARRPAEHHLGGTSAHRCVASGAEPLDLPIETDTCYAMFAR
jgi:hypothetical protein